MGWEVGRVLLRTWELSKPLSSSYIKESSPFPQSSCYSRRRRELNGFANFCFPFASIHRYTSLVKLGFEGDEIIMGLVCVFQRRSMHLNTFK